MDQTAAEAGTVAVLGIVETAVRPEAAATAVSKAHSPADRWVADTRAEDNRFAETPAIAEHHTATAENSAAAADNLAATADTAGVMLAMTAVWEGTVRASEAELGRSADTEFAAVAHYFAVSKVPG